MDSMGRRSAIQKFPALVVVSIGGCLGDTPSSSTGPPTESNPVRTIGPTQTEGSLIEVSMGNTSLDDIEQELRRTVSNRTDCIVEKIPIQPYDSGILVTTRTIVPSIDNADIEFPSPSYDLLKKVAPSSIIVTSASDSPDTEDEYPVYIKAILQKEEREEIIPRMSDSC
ncbi:MULTISPECIES: hypothetical protein [Halolamina]|uniref:hypothetical protein n=1 Tax=Halolamina TaxID=1075397 RepID=UPI0011606E23|nr:MULTISPECIES: hypothetical protein [Halolamina]NHX37280.1 hypothetical protein [Halolamina sp. R1-12]